MQMAKLKQNSEKKPKHFCVFLKGPTMKQMYNFRSNEKWFLTIRDVKSNDGTVT